MGPNVKFMVPPASLVTTAAAVREAEEEEEEDMTMKAVLLQFINTAVSVFNQAFLTVTETAAAS
ncbi:hypothetical protein BDBG_16313 [Blastomyces gilchristii SLH14081]|uniref:Uncharacterized protein n=1 Tax=Blastomyces gilchristii (strain SLH14081) TaxID=559298 RepID=A0A179UAB6_BLAGS|nr:uncharacterized protein BDBG_16313 [Blastomyces gilchristii SLH14081]OAT04663.1 hypothetical protein BDBG_16313 [Blastomyces gilchristii SLH14081]